MKQNCSEGEKEDITVSTLYTVLSQARGFNSGTTTHTVKPTSQIRLTCGYGRTKDAARAWELQRV